MASAGARDIDREIDQLRRERAAMLGLIAESELDVVAAYDVAFKALDTITATRGRVDKLNAAIDTALERRSMLEQPT